MNTHQNTSTPATAVHHLLSLRPRLAEDILLYFVGADGEGGLADELDKLQLFSGSGPIKEQMRISRVFVEATVHELRKSQEAPPEKKNGADENLANKVSRILPWSEFFRQTREPVVLLGEPGSGKTSATKQMVIAAARNLAGALEKRSTAADFEIPLWVTADRLAKAPGLEGRGHQEDATEDAVAALIAALPQGLAMPLRLRDYLKRRLMSGQGLVVVDSLDEALPLASGNSSLARRLSALGQTGLKLVFTCRTEDWDRCCTWVKCDRVAELANLRLAEQKKFAGYFFAGQSRLGKAFIERLSSSEILRQTCDKPLLLTFAALLQQQEELEGTVTVPDLYGAILRGLMARRWHNKPPAPWAEDMYDLDQVLEHLAAMAWYLFVGNDQLNSFTGGDWDRAFAGARKEPPQFQSAKGQPAEALTSRDLLEDLKTSGLIIRASVGTAGSTIYSFAHKTFIEFLAAFHLYLDHQARSRHRPGWPRPEEADSQGQEPSELRWLIEQERPFHFRPEWLQTMTFIAALLEDATLLLDALEREPESVFRTTFDLQCQFLAAAPKKTPQAWVDRLVRRWGDWRKQGHWDLVFQSLWFRCASTLARHPGAWQKMREGFMAPLDPSSDYYQYSCIDLLFENSSYAREGYGWVDANYTLWAMTQMTLPGTDELLQAALEAEHRSYHRKQIQATQSALERRSSGDDSHRGTETFISDERRREIDRIRGTGRARELCAELVSRLTAPIDHGNDRSWQETYPGDEFRLAQIAEELGHLGCPEGVPALLGALQRDRYQNPRRFEIVRRAAAEALGRIGDPEACPALLKSTLMQHENELLVQRNAAASLWVIAQRCPADFRPGGRYAESIFRIPEELRPPWRPPEIKSP